MTFLLALGMAVFDTAVGGTVDARIQGGGKPDAGMEIRLENECVKYVIGEDGRNLHFVDKRTWKDYCRETPSTWCGYVRKNGQSFGVTSASYSNGKLRLVFGQADVTVLIKVTIEKRYLVFEVVSVTGGPVQELTFVNLDLTTKGTADEPFAGCALALNLKTNVTELPQSNSRLKAMCYSRIGLVGAAAAVIGCPKDELREVMQEVVSASPELPHSPIGGPWALDGPDNRGSYLFNFGGMSEETVDDWIKLAKSLGINQIDFHGGDSFRFGDCEPNPKTYPKGLASLKAVIDKLHANGIKAGLHTYAFFIDKRCPWVTPVPDPGLAKDAVFTLAEPLTSDADVVPTVESTEKMSTTTGFFVRNSVTLQIDDELIIYSGILKTPPYSFTGCQRGAYGTKPAAHAKGAKVHHLKECFGLFVPDPDTRLFQEVAASTARTFNECGFDMMYLDALDGEDILGGTEFGWHYGSKFVFELWKRLKRPALMEMSTFHHHLWYVRSRMGAWDHPTRSHKRFIDLHCKSNESNLRMFLPGHLGWWAVKTHSAFDLQPTFTDDIEYLCGKCIGTDCGLSIMGVDPQSIVNNPALARLGGIIRDYEELRRSGRVPESVKAMLREPGKEFTLEKEPNGKSRLRPVEYVKHTVQSSDESSLSWTVTNRFSEQQPVIRLEALFSAGPYDAPENVTLADFNDVKAFTRKNSAPGVTVNLQPSSDFVKVGNTSGCYRALCAHEPDAVPSEGFSPTEHGVRRAQGEACGWSQVGRIFSPLMDLSKHQALGVWVYGDGQGEVLNLQVRSPEHISSAIYDHYITVDFTGWRYFELIEPEGDRYEHVSWPYGGLAYSIYRERVDYSKVESFDLWYGNLPCGKEVKCFISPVKALPLVVNKLRNPKITIGEQTIEFPVDIQSGSYLEFRSMSDCKLYGSDGQLLAEVTPKGQAPQLVKGENRLSFSCEGASGINARARITVGCKGKAIEIKESNDSKK